MPHPISGGLPKQNIKGTERSGWVVLQFPQQQAAKYQDLNSAALDADVY